MQVNLASEMNVLARRFHRLSMRELADPRLHLQRHAGGARGGHCGVSRSIAPMSRRKAPARTTAAISNGRLAQARKRWHGQRRRHLRLHPPGPDRRCLRTDVARRAEEVLRVAMHFQQVTGPVMAKAAEDTAFYRYFRLLALNEVGGDPRRFGMSVAAFHHLTRDRARHWPRAMVTTATHDTKRGEDGRAAHCAVVGDAARMGPTGDPVDSP